MSWLFSQALVAAYLEDTYSDGEQSALSSGSPTQLAYLPPDKMMAFSRLSRFGMTFKPLTADRGEAVLMSYLEAFPVKTSPQQEGEPESKASDLACGEKWLGWSAKFDPHTSTLRTAQCSLLEEEPELLQTLPRSGMTRSGMLWERQTLVLRTSETESGSWPTPMSSEYKANKNYRPGRQNGLTQAVMKWPTPTVCGNYNRKGLSETSGDGLATAVSKWPTPTAHNAKETDAPSEHSRNTPTFAAQAGGILNPTWVEWLMGWPLGWTDLKPLEMDKFQQWQQQHSDYL
jgi:hypothetical protein